MSKSSFSFVVGGAMALLVSGVASGAHADTPRYRYVALDQVPLPAPYTTFAPSTVINGQVFGTVFDNTFTIANVATYDKGAIAIGPSGFASVAVANGTIGGADLSNEAALFSGGTTTLVPRLPGESFANVVALGDNKLALVGSTNSSFVTTFAYFRNGTESVINFGLPDPVFGGFMNNAGLVAVTKEESATDQFLHGYLYNPQTQRSTLLPPFAGDPTDVMVLLQGINQNGEVLGYSFTNFSSPAYHERVGVWNSAGVFQPFFEETINTNLLVFNDQDEIVISNSSDSHSYLVPAPGTRLDLATLVTNVPAGLQLVQVVGIDNPGNIVGFAADATLSNFFPFLLVPMAANEPTPAAAHVSASPIPWAVAHRSDKQHPKK